MYEAQLTRKTEVVTLRMPSDRVDQIKKEARNRKVSFNVLSNHIFDEYFDFNMYAKGAGYMTLPKKTVSIFLDSLSEEDIAKKGGKPTKLVLVDLIYLMKGRFTLQSFLNTFFAWIRDSRFAYNDHFEDGARTITVNHNMGKKWSLLLKEVVEMMLVDLHIPVRFEILSNVLVFSISEGVDEK